jgi:hypothetical protein
MEWRQREPPSAVVTMARPVPVGPRHVARGADTLAVALIQAGLGVRR